MFLGSTVTTRHAEGSAGTDAHGAARAAQSEMGGSMPRRSQVRPLQGTTPGCAPSAAVRSAGQSTACGATLALAFKHSSMPSRFWVAALQLSLRQAGDSSSVRVGGGSGSSRRLPCAHEMAG